MVQLLVTVSLYSAPARVLHLHGSRPLPFQVPSAPERLIIAEIHGPCVQCALPDHVASLKIYSSGCCAHIEYLSSCNRVYKPRAWPRQREASAAHHFCVLLLSPRPFDDEPSLLNRHSSPWSSVSFVFSLAVSLLFSRPSAPHLAISRVANNEVGECGKRVSLGVCVRGAVYSKDAGTGLRTVSIGNNARECN